MQTDGNMFACNSLIAAHKSPRTGNDSPHDAQLGSPATNQPPTSYSINDADELSQISHNRYQVWRFAPHHHLCQQITTHLSW